MPMRPVFRRSVFNKERALPRMSWSHQNLYNIWQRVHPDGPLASESNFTRTSMTLYQQRWRSKRLGREYHGDHIGNTKFERWYVPDALPSIHAGGASASSSSSAGGLDRSRSVASTIAGKTREGGRKYVASTREAKEVQGRAAVGTMLYREVERRVDVLVFRACLATSVWQARGWVVHGRVRVNGLVETNPNTRLSPGDIFSVDPSIIPMLSEAESKRAEKKEKKVLRASGKGRKGGRFGKGEEGTVVEEAEEGNEVEAEEVEAEPVTKGEAEASGSKVEGETKAESSTTITETTSSSDSPATTTIPTPSKTDTTSSTSIPTPTPTPAPKPLAFFTLPPFASPHLFVPAYLEVSFKTCSAVYVRHPTARAGYSEIPSPYDADGEVMSLGWEWFKRKAPNMTKRRHRWMDPERQNDRK